MSINLHGKIPSPIYINSKIGKVLSTFTVTFKDGDTVLQQVQVRQGGTAVYDGTVPAKDGNAFLGWVLSEPSNPIVDSDNVTAYQQISNVQSDVTCWAVYGDKRIIHDSWADISQYSQAGTAQNHYSVGDMKRIHIEGTVGTIAVNQDVYVYILGFDHNTSLEGSGITFGCFKDVNSLKDICLVYSDIYSSATDGTKMFNINHWGYHNYGGWSVCDMRYDILGSTDVAPSGYGTAPESSRVGYNATPTCATSPVANTLMSCLPSDLRAVMKPITKYTDNIGGGTNVATNVTASIDYLPLLSEYEIFDSINYVGNNTEEEKQSQYTYYANGNSKIKYRYNDINEAYQWWTRTPARDSNTMFCRVEDGGIGTGLSGKNSRGLAPIFLV